MITRQQIIERVQAGSPWHGITISVKQAIGTISFDDADDTDPNCVNQLATTIHTYFGIEGKSELYTYIWNYIRRYVFPDVVNPNSDKVVAAECYINKM